MASKKFEINYTDRDFNSIKRSLVEHARRYYPDVYRDFNQASFGSLLFDTVSYVGDVLSFYLDYQVNENFLETATETDNVISLARNVGYKYYDSITSYGVCAFYIEVPSDTIQGIGPDLTYAPILKKGTRLSSVSDGQYILMDNVDFSNPENTVTVSRVSEDTGAPTHYAIKSYGQVRSGLIQEYFVQVGPHKRFRSITVTADNVSEILSVRDSEGHDYYEVGHLSQDVVYVPVENRNSDKHSVPHVIKPMSVPRRYTVEHFPGRLELQFGQGSDEELISGSYADPSKVVMNKFGQDYVSDLYFDPTNFTSTEKMGISPANTTLSVRLIRDNISQTNAPPGAINSVVDPQYSVENVNTLSDSTLQEVFRSVEVENEDPVNGDTTSPTLEEIRLQSKYLYASQNRAVTKQDYKSMIYAMPSKFGSIKRCSLQVDRDSFKRNLNLYVLTQNTQGILQRASITLKNNLKKWIGEYRMMADSMDIMDAKIINFSVHFEVVGAPNADKEALLVECNRRVQEYFAILPEIGESLQINEIYNVLGKLEKVLDVTEVKITNIQRSGYQGVAYDVRRNLSLDGRTLSIPHDHIYEMRDPTENIRGTVI